MRVALTGASGLIGSALTDRLGALGHTVIPMVRRNALPGEIAWDPSIGPSDPAWEPSVERLAPSLGEVDAVINLAGPGIGDHRWTDAYRRRLRDARVDGTRMLCEAIARSTRPPSALLNASAIGYYGDRGDETLTESSPPGEGFLADLCVDWEAAVDVPAGTRAVVFRTGVVLTERGGALAKMLPLFRLGLGGRFGSGRQWFSWISLEDEIAAITTLLAGTEEGVFNLTAPTPVTNADFASWLGRALGRPTVLAVPKFGPRTLLGRELADALLFDSARVLPHHLQETGYEFTNSDLASIELP